MQKVGEKIILSASDLVGHLNCHYLTTLDIELANGLRKKPKDDALRLETIRRLGFEHEERFVAHLQKSYPHIARVEGDGISDETVQKTIALMRDGADVIVQAAFDNGKWRGKADILRKVENKPSKFGSWSYEVLDTKLAEETKGGTILQLCLYSEFVRDIQGALPEFIYVVPPSADFIEQKYRTSDFLAYFRKVKNDLEKFLEIETHDGLYPDPVPHCDVCRWQFECDKKRHDDDHLSLVAGITKGQRVELEKQRITTCSALAEMPLPLQWRPERGAKESIVKVREQARIQVEGRKAGKVLHEILETDEEFGLRLMPEPDRGDIFFDLEGDPFFGSQGLEYLFGYSFLKPDGTVGYEAIWANNIEEEKIAFETFMNFVSKRLQEFPGLHIYHYAPYEPSALKRLMGRHGICEVELDFLLRGKRFIDLYAVIKRTLRASVESYSIKNLEPLFGYERDQDLRKASQARALMETQLETGLIGDIDPETREIVRKYNKDDCVSNLELRNWLEKERARLIADGIDLPRREISSGDASETAQDRQQRTRLIRDKLLENVPSDPAERSPRDNAYWLMANMLEWHWREQKVALWEKFRLMALDEDGLLEDPAAITGLKLVDSFKNEKGRVRFRYSFPFQETAIRPGNEIFSIDGSRRGKVVDISFGEGWIETARDLKFNDGGAKAIFAADIMEMEALKFPIGAITKIAEDLAAAGLESGNFKATKSLLLNESPAHRGVKIRLDNEDPLSAACRVVKKLEGQVFPIQGPPGTGKTYTAAHMICSLIADGKRVGVTGTSHKVIHNLVDEVLEISAQQKQNFKCVMRIEGDISGKEAVRNIRVVKAKDNPDIAEKAKDSSIPLIAGTTFFWSRDDAEQIIDVLFVDEAAQMSLANVIAASRAAKSLVLIGDPRQLEQPLRGAHPEGADVSSLDHLIGLSDTITDDRGLFLDLTYRLSPSICDFTSEIFYEHRLHSRPSNKNISIKSVSPFSGQGLRYVAIDHEGNQNSSAEEVSIIAKLFSDLTAGHHRFINHEGQESIIGTDDVLIVAPYNLQVFKLRQKLPEARIGTVDKFQGQEAPIVIYSLTSSSQQDAPRGMEFLYSLNRLNVATSRAKAMCILVGSPKLFDASCRTPRQIQLANAFCRYLERAETIKVS